MSEVADPEKKYVLVAVKNCGLRAGDFMTMTRGDSNLTLTGTIISGNWDRNTMPRTYNVTLTVGTLQETRA